VKTGRTIYFISWKTLMPPAPRSQENPLWTKCIGASSSAVEKYIRDGKLFESVQRKIGDFEKFSAFCAAS